MADEEIFGTSPDSPTILQLEDWIYRLKEHGISKCFDEVVANETKIINSMAMKANQDEYRKVVEDGLRALIEKHGEAATTDMFVKDHERFRELLLDYNSLRNQPPPPGPVEEDWLAVKRPLMQLPTSADMNKVTKELFTSLDELQASCSLEEAETLKELQSFMLNLNSSMTEGQRVYRTTAESLEKSGLKSSWNLVVDSIACLRDPFGSKSEEHELYMQEVREKLKSVVDEFGIEPVENQLRQRFANMVEAIDSTEMWPAQKVVDCPPDLEKAILSLLCNIQDDKDLLK